jgi:hypothetical protein
VKDIQSGIGSSNPEGFTVFNGKLFFTADDGSDSGRELWISDGTTAGTHSSKILDRALILWGNLFQPRRLYCF